MLGRQVRLVPVATVKRRDDVTVDIVIPVYNEEAQLAASVTALRDYLCAFFPYNWSITIADNASTNFRVYLNKTMMGGAITFGMPTSYPTLATPTTAVAADFNGDGKLDFATANNTDRSVSLFLGKGMGLFNQTINYDIGIGPVWLATGDINGDKKPDLATANQSAGTVSVLLNTGNFN